MKNILKRFGIPAVIAASLLVMVGCLVSGTFVVIADISPTVSCLPSAIKFYHGHLDLSTESEWQDHKDKIDYIDAIGFDFWIRNESSASATFSLYAEEHSAPDRITLQAVKDSASLVFGELTVSAGDSIHVAYGESLSYVKNLADLRAMVKEGMFHFYGLAEGTYTDNQICVDSAKAVITFSAGI